VCACSNNYCGSQAGNCGVVDVRVAFSRERGAAGTVFYVPVSEGRDAVIPLGRNTCFNSSCGWCHADHERTLERTAWDTSQIYSIPGLYTPPERTGEEAPPDGEGTGVLLYYNGSPWTHGQTFGIVSAKAFGSFPFACNGAWGIVNLAELLHCCSVSARSCINDGIA
jgi:hypothetical protein